MPLTAFEMFEGQAVDWGSGEQRGALLSRSLHGRACWNPQVCPRHQWQMDVWVPLGLPSGTVELFRGILLPLESLRDFFYLLMQSERAIWTVLKTHFSPLRRVLPLVIPMGFFDIDKAVFPGPVLLKAPAFVEVAVRRVWRWCVHAGGCQGCPREDVASRYPELCCGFLILCCPRLLNGQCFQYLLWQQKTH